MKPCMNLVKIRIFFTKSGHGQTYQNYEQPPQTSQNLYFQSHFFVFKIGQIFQKKISMKNYAQFLLALFIILVGLMMTRFSEKCLFLLDAYVVSCPTWSKNLGRTLVTIFHVNLLSQIWPEFFQSAGPGFVLAVAQIVIGSSWVSPIRHFQKKCWFLYHILQENIGAHIWRL